MTRAEQIAQIRADVEEGKRQAAERFEATFGMPMTRENVRGLLPAIRRAVTEGRTSISKADLA